MSAAVDEQLGTAATSILTQRAEASREDFHEFASFCMRDEHGHAIVQESLHRVIQLHVDVCWAAGMHAAVLAPFGHGKCQPGSAPIQMADGSTRPIAELVGGGEVLGFDEGDVCYRPASARSFPNGKRRVLRLSLFSGRSIEVTEKHPLWTVKGWRPAFLAKVGTYVGTVRRMPDLGSVKLLSGEAALLGYFVGDGGTTHRARFTCYEHSTFEDFKFCCSQMGFGLNPDPNRFEFYVRGARSWLRRHGLLGCSSHSKRTPPAIFTAPKVDVASYLGAYFACDGHVSSERGGSVELYSVNRELLDDAQSLLLRFGIRSRIRRKRGTYEGGPHLSWRLSVTGAGNLETFRSSIRVPGIKGRAFARLDLSKAPNPNEDGVPLEYRWFLERSAHWHKRNSGISLDQQSKRTTSRRVVRKAALAEGNVTLLRATSDNVTWERVVAVEDLGELDTFGLEVDRLHAYVSGDVVCHNTVQTAVGRVCWELGRDQTLRWKLVCNNDTKAKERVMGCTALMFSSAYRLTFPHIRPVPAEQAKKFKKPSKITQHEVFLDRPGMALDASIQAAGVLSGGTGGRCDRILFDDVVDQKNALDEPTMRTKVIHNMENVWMQRLTPKGLAAYLGTAWHQADATHRLMDNPAWSVLVCAISADFRRIDMQVYNPPARYPLPVLAGQVGGSAPEARGWIEVRSSNLRAVRYDQAGQRLDVSFLSGGIYSYAGVPRSLFDSMLAADSAGAFLNQNVKGIFPHERIDAPPGANGSAKANGRFDGSARPLGTSRRPWLDS